MKTKLIIWALVSIILAQPILALGMMPAYKTLFFDPDVQSTHSFTVLSRDKTNQGIQLYVEGDIKRYISLHETSTIIKGESKTISYTVNMPEQLKPGVHTGYIVVEEFEPEDTKGQTQIATKIKLNHKITLISPYPRKYLEANLETREFADYFDVVIKLFNVGNSTIHNIYADTSIFEGDKKLQTLTSSKSNLAKRAKDEILIRLSRATIKNGVYHIISDMNYDGNKHTLESPIIIGEPHIKILNYTQSFNLGEINKFEALLENEWNKEIKDAYVDFYIFKGNKEISRIKTPLFNLNGYEKKAVSVYWKSKITELGIYDAILILNYNGKSEETTFTIELVEGEVNKLFVILLTAIIVIAGVAIIYQLYKPKPKDLHNVRELAVFMLRELRSGKILKDIESKLLESGWSKKHIQLAKKALKKNKR